MKSAADRDDRKKNVIIYGVSETEGEVVANKIEEVLSQLNEKPMIKDCPDRTEEERAAIRIERNKKKKEVKEVEEVKAPCQYPSDD